MLLKPSVLAVGIALSANALAQSSPVQVVDINSPSVSRSSSTGAQSAAPATTTVQVNQNAQLLMLVDQLQEEVRFLRGQVEQQSYQMKKMQTNQRDRYRDLDRRIMSITQQLSSQTAASTPAVVEDLTNNSSSASQEPTNDSVSSAPSTSTSTVAVPVVQPPTGETDKQAYSKAFKLVRDKSYSESIKAFDDFVRFYPNSTLVANAIFWQGEVYRAMTPPDFEAAKTAYQRLISQFPQHSKAADAYYKLGLTLDDLGDKAAAKQTMQKAIDLYPDQSVSRLAKEYLSK